MHILLLLSTPTVLARKFSCSVVSIWKLLQLNLHLLRFCCPPTASELYRLTLTSFWLTLGAVAWLFFVAIFFPCLPFPLSHSRLRSHSPCLCMSFGALRRSCWRLATQILLCPRAVQPLAGRRTLQPNWVGTSIHAPNRSRTCSAQMKSFEPCRLAEWRMGEQNRMRCWLLWKAHKTKLRKTHTHDIQAANEPETKQFYDIRRVASRLQSLRNETRKGTEFGKLLRWRWRRSWVYRKCCWQRTVVQCTQAVSVLEKQ